MRNNSEGKKILKLFGAIVLLASVAISVAIAYLMHMGACQAPSRGPSPIVRDNATKSADGREEKALVRGQKVAVLIDDIGMNTSVVHELLKIRIPITFAVLPFSRYAAATASILHESRREILLHLPMEPQKYPEENPGKGALFSSMGDEEIERQLAESLSAVPHIVGVNNHMGSRFMEDEAKLDIVMRELKRRRLFFVDSLTTPRSKGRQAARRFGVRFASRNLFLDSTHDYTATFRTLLHLYDAQANPDREPALVIGHPYRETVQVLKELLPLLQKEGMEFVPVSGLVR